MVRRINLDWVAVVVVVCWVLLLSLLSSWPSLVCLLQLLSCSSRSCWCLWLDLLVMCSRVLGALLSLELEWGKWSGWKLGLCPSCAAARLMYCFLWLWQHKRCLCVCCVLVSMLQWFLAGELPPWTWSYLVGFLFPLTAKWNLTPLSQWCCSEAKFD